MIEICIMRRIVRTHLITSCAKGKNKLTPDSPALDIQEGTSPENALRLWLEQTQPGRNKTLLAATDLYRGTHWSTAKEIQRSAQNVELWVISAGMGFLHSSDMVVPYEATFHQIPFSHAVWWQSLNNSFCTERRASSISNLMNLNPMDDYVIAGSPVYIKAVEHDVQEGLKALQNPVKQLTIITSKAYSGLLEPYLIRSHAGMLGEFNSNMVCLNIKLAQSLIAGRLDSKNVQNSTHFTRLFPAPC